MDELFEAKDFNLFFDDPLHFKFLLLREFLRSKISAVLAS